MIAWLAKETSTQNGNGHKCLLVINRVYKAIHDSSKLFANS